jgi:superfamily I DNA/RNA helicase
MAHILPENLPQIMPPEVHRVFRSLKSLPDDYTVWHHLAPWDPNAPDFLLLKAGKGPLLIKVSPASAAQATPAAQLLLLADSRTRTGQNETEVLERFIQRLGFQDCELPGQLVVFPNISHHQALEARPGKHAVEKGEPAWAGKELLAEERSPHWDEFLPTQLIEPLLLEKVRLAFSPEVVVPAELTVRLPVERRVKAGLSGFLLDYDQEAAVKTDLDLEQDGQMVSTDFQLNILNGVAGSGKTLILLYRLRLLYHLYPQKRFLVLTHNRPLIHDLESRFCRLEGKAPESIEWCTFTQWCLKQVPKDLPKPHVISQTSRWRLVQQVWRQHLSHTSVKARSLMSEIDWLKDQLPMSLEQYQTADRRGRGFGLTSELRSLVFLAYETFQKMLEDQGLVDWGDIPQQLWLRQESGQTCLPQYDAVLVDEAQFFAPLWVALLQKALKPPNPHLFIVADPTQGFLGRGASWKSLGLQARGRSQQLRRSYRTTREILGFAALFYRLRLSDEQEEDILAPDLLNMPNGALPEMIALTSAQDEISRVANEVEAFVKRGYPRKHLLILHASGQGVRSLIEAINYRLGRDAAIDPKDTFPGDYIRVTTLNAGAGLESPIVFLVGLRELFEEEQSLRLSDDEREAMIRDHTRKIYMAATRAGQRLVFTYVGEPPSALWEALG